MRVYLKSAICSFIYKLRGYQPVTQLAAAERLCKRGGAQEQGAVGDLGRAGYGQNWSDTVQKQLLEERASRCPDAQNLFKPVRSIDILPRNALLLILDF